jgi:hypothetical protein
MHTHTHTRLALPRFAQPDAEPISEQANQRARLSCVYNAALNGIRYTQRHCCCALQPRARAPDVAYENSFSVAWNRAMPAVSRRSCGAVSRQCRVNRANEMAHAHAHTHTRTTKHTTTQTHKKHRHRHTQTHTHTDTHTHTANEVNTQTHMQAQKRRTHLPLLHEYGARLLHSAHTGAHTARVRGPVHAARAPVTRRRARAQLLLLRALCRARVVAATARTRRCHRRTRRR